MRTIHLKKPTYVSTAAQIAALRAEHEVSGTFSEKKTAGRIAAGMSLKGTTVALTRLGGSRVIVPADETDALGVDVEDVALLASVDRKTGEVLLTIA